MSQISVESEIPAPPEKVWETIVTPATYESWLTIHTKWKSDVEGKRFEPGATIEEVVTMLGMANTISWTVDEFEDGARMKISGTGMAGVQVSFEFRVESDGDGGSRATLDAEFEGQMITGALGKAVERDSRDQLEQSVAKLSALLVAAPAS